MKLNIETTNAAGTQKVLQQVFTGEEVSIVCEYEKTVDYEILPKGIDKRCKYVYSAESILDLAAVIPSHKIRIY